MENQNLVIRRRSSQPGAHTDTDVPWRQANYCAIDVETTGLDLRHDEIVSIGTVAIREGRIDAATSDYTVVRCNRPPSIAAIQVHCLRPFDISGGIEPGEAAARTAAAIGKSILVAHAAWIERAFVGRLLRQAGLALPELLLDTAALARACGHQPPTGYEPALEQLATNLGLPVHSPHHALGDAMTTATLFLALACRLEAESGDQQLTAKELFTMSAAYSS